VNQRIKKLILSEFPTKTQQNISI